MPKVGNLIVPLVHSNGSSRDVLVEQRKEACNLLHAALEQLCQMRPHGRDFLDHFEYQQARDYHETRITQIRKMLEELRDEAIAIQVQGRK